MGLPPWLATANTFKPVIALAWGGGAVYGIGRSVLFLVRLCRGKARSLREPTREYLLGVGVLMILGSLIDPIILLLLSGHSIARWMTERGIFYASIQALFPVCVLVVWPTLALDWLLRQSRSTGPG